MKTPHTAAVRGVFVEFFNAEGHCVGQTLFADWEQQPLPLPGDTFACDAASTVSGRLHKLQGVVAARCFEVQRDEQGEPAVWVRISVRVGTARRLAVVPFSRN